MDHLSALELRLSHERSRLAKAKTAAETAMRSVWVAQIEKEIAAELEFLGQVETALANENLTDDELLAELGA